MTMQEPSRGKSLDKLKGLRFGGIIGSFAGAYPAGKPAPPLLDIPKGINLLYLAFARELGRDGVFKAEWDLSSDNAITPERIKEDQSKNGRFYFASLAGDGNVFDPVVPKDQWVESALGSLRGLKSRYYLTGFDVNYEKIYNTNLFKSCMKEIFEETAGEIAWSVSPFSSTNSLYRQLVEETKPAARPFWINYQQYASGKQTKEENIRDLRNVMAGYKPLFLDKISFGVVTDLKNPRGAAPEVAIEVIKSLRRELGGAFSWAAEFSESEFAPPYKFEIDARRAFSPRPSNG